jgi:hypothetical protein
MPDMKAKLLKLQKIINNEKAEDFKNKWYGQYLSDDVTFTFGSKSYTMAFFKGTLIEIMEGVNLTGVEMGVIGPEEGWQELYAHKNFSRAIGPMHGKLRLQGNMVKCMGNLNPLGYMARVLCSVI